MRFKFVWLLLAAALVPPGSAWAQQVEARLDRLPSPRESYGHEGYGGQIEVEGQRYEVRFLDAVKNGRIEDRIKKLTFCENCKVSHDDADLIQLGEAGRPLGYDAAHPLPDWVVIGKRLYALRLAEEDGALRMTLEPADGETTLRLPEGLLRLALVETEGRGAVAMIHPAADGVPMPAGRYHVMEYQLDRKDAEGDNWQVHAGGSQATQPIELVAGTEAAAQFGEPFTAAVAAELNEQRGLFSTQRVAMLELKLTGGANEKVFDVTHEGTKTKHPLSTNRRRPKEPTWQVVRADGERVANGSFEYG